MGEIKEIRLNKYLSEAGLCSRREADRFIQEGKVTVDGRAAQVGQKIVPGQKVVFDGRTVAAGEGREGSSVDGHKAAPVLLAVNKPRGIVCTTSDKDRAQNIVELIHYPSRVYPMGRLDKDSEGLILLTNQGDLVNRMMRGGNGHEKEYQVVVDKTVTEEFVHEMEKGVFLPELDVKTKLCRIQKTGEKAFQIILTQGLNRQIRRMCTELGYDVRTLKRTRIMNIRLGELKTGGYRPVTEEEKRRLMEMLKGSGSLPCKGKKNQTNV